jgi:inhibitor of KinA
VGAAAKIVPLGECAFVVKFGDEIDPVTHRHVVELTRSLEENPFAGFQETVPSYTAVAVYYDPVAVASAIRHHRESDVQEQVRFWLEERVALLNFSFGADTGRETGTTVHIPVCYCVECGPDLQDVAELNNLSPETVVKIHTSVTYTVYMIGFMPGFPYLGGMSERIAAPRLATPRRRVPAGSVGIAGRQTGIYPYATPGGWRLIGRTSVPLFRPDRSPPSLLSAGDIVRFKAVAHSEMEAGACR